MSNYQISLQTMPSPVVAPVNTGGGLSQISWQGGSFQGTLGYFGLDQAGVQFYLTPADGSTPSDSGIARTLVSSSFTPSLQFPSTGFAQVEFSPAIANVNAWGPCYVTVVRQITPTAVSLLPRTYSSVNPTVDITQIRQNIAAVANPA